ncbi:MAG: hypothetical protein P4K93_16665 [Terracidiphilus sp.]|nr:hypothetical protein [Terracidiphilus sp.]
MDEESSKRDDSGGEVREQLEKLLAQVSGMQELTSQVFTARQGFYEKLILLDGATLTLLFTVVGGLSHSAITMDTLDKLGRQIFIGCWLFILSIMLSLLHNHLNIANLVHLSSWVKRTSVHGNLRLFGISVRRAGVPNEFEGLPDTDPEAAKSLRRGTATENLCRWIGVLAQAMTISGYIVLVTSLQAAMRALAGGAH